MRSSTGQHFVGLDHVRGVAALLVVVWHFTHGFTGDPVPFNAAPLLGLLDEGHSGVALFMTLSGYLFAKLLDGRRIRFGAFLWNRFIRLAPLLTVVIVVTAFLVPRAQLALYLESIAWGLVRPTLPNGGWSITAELHFYLLLPLLLSAVRNVPRSPLVFVAAAVATRLVMAGMDGDLKDLSYWTIVGRIDQFLLGIFFYHHRAAIGNRAAWLAASCIVAFYAWFDASGGFYGFPASGEAVWAVIPTVEGLTFGALIAWYDARPLRSSLWIAKLLQKAGEYSYSIYLLHVFVVFDAAAFVHRNVMDISSFALALPWALAFFLAMIGVGRLSFFCIEAPFLKFRRAYLRDLVPAGDSPRLAPSNARVTGRPADAACSPPGRA